MQCACRIVAWQILPSEIDAGEANDARSVGDDGATGDRLAGEPHAPVSSCARATADLAAPRPEKRVKRKVIDDETFLQAHTRSRRDFSGVDLRARYLLAGGRQFRISVIGVAVASPTGRLIRNRPSRATAYSGRLTETDPPSTMRVGKSATGVPASTDVPAAVMGTAISVASGARK